jgi:hypothetical protein
MATLLPGHWDEYWGQGLFFIIAAIAQLLWASSWRSWSLR